MGDVTGGHWDGRLLYGGAAQAAAAAAEATTTATVSSSGGGSPRVEAGRVGKPARRRSRASRRAPVTLLNTDTSNFRAMVQQFTGVPYGPAGGVGPVISFGAGVEYGAPVRPAPTTVMAFDHHHHQLSSQHQTTTSLQQGQLFRPQHQYGYTDGGGGDMSSFLHGGFGDPSSASAEDRMLLQSIQAAQMVPGSGTSRPASTNTTTTTTNNGFNFG